MCSLAKDIGIDLGTASVLVYIKGKGVVLNEPSVVAIDKNTGRLLKVGAEAQAMLGRTPGNIVAIRPLRDGVISDYDMTERMLKEFIRKVTGGFHLFPPRIMVCVPSGITEVEERAVIDAGRQAGARRVYLIEEPVAAAIGAGIDITKPDGHMVVDIGGGTSDIAVISLSGVVESASIKVAGDQFNESIVKYMRRKHNILIGERTAEQMKMEIGCVYPKEEEATIEIKGRCLMTGLPKTITVNSTEMMEAFEEPVERILEAVHNVLERTPPELVADISNNGIVMTGGGSLVDGFDKLITARTGIHLFVMISVSASGIAHTYTLRWPYRGSDSAEPFDIRTDTNDKFYYLWRKFVPEGLEQTERDTYGLDIPLIRYAEVLLLKAEALNEWGSTHESEAIRCVNEVRRRAGHVELNNATYPATKVNGQSDLRERIRNEYYWEIGGEDSMYFHELRWGTWKDKKFDNNRNGLMQMWGETTYTWYWLGDQCWSWPIPAKEMEMNSNLEQNEGWIN